MHIDSVLFVPISVIVSILIIINHFILLPVFDVEKYFGGKWLDLLEREAGLFEGKASLACPTG